MIYLDNASTTKMDDAVLRAMLPYLKENYGNAGSLHSMGRKAYDAIQHAREQVAEFINASPEQIIFTSGGTEANNMATNNFTDRLGGYPYIYCSAYEHDSVINSIPWDDEEFLIPVSRDGRVDLTKLIEILEEADALYGDKLISVMHTNNELGTINPIPLISEMCHKYENIYFHTDCVQAAGFSPIDVEKFKCDFLTISSHKIHGPKGVGALYIRKPDNDLPYGICRPLIFGGDSQEFGLRGGTENVAGIVGFGTACELAGAHLEENRYKIISCVEAFTETLEESLLTHGITDVLHYNTEVAKPSKILNVRFDGVKAETLLMALDAVGICVSAGSACNASSGKPSHVLKAIGLTDEQARSSIRISFSKDNSIEVCRQAASLIAYTVKILLNNSK